MLCEDSNVYQQAPYEFKEELQVLIEARKDQQRSVYTFLDEVHGGNFRKILKKKIKLIEKAQVKKKDNRKMRERKQSR